MATKQQTFSVNPFKYSNRVVLKTILEREDGGIGLVGERVVIGGWVKSFKEVKKETEKLSVVDEKAGSVVDEKASDVTPKDVTCSKIRQSRIPFIRSIIKVFGGRSYSVREKLEPVAPKPRPSPIAFLQVGDGSSPTNLQIAVDSSIAPTIQLLHTGSCVMAEGVLIQSSAQGKHVIELQLEKILHLGTVEHDKYPLSNKRLPLNFLRDCSHFRPRTTTVGSIMRIRSALTFATHTFYQNHGFLYVDAPIITSTDCEGFSEKFHVTTIVDREGIKEEPNAIGGINLETIKAAVKEKSKQVEELKRSESNREALAAAVQDLKKTSEFASQLEAREKSKPKISSKAEKVKYSADFFSRQIHLTTSGRLHLASYACALGHVYSFGPRFQADSVRQLAEMWVVEMEIAFSQLEDAINCAEDFLKFLCKWVLDNCSQDMKFVLRRMDKTSIERLQSVTSTSIERVTYTEALNVLKKVTDKKFETELQWGCALTTEHQSYLVDEIYKRPVIIYNHPKQAKSFYVHLNDDGQTVASFDLAVPKAGTLISGSQNEDRFNYLSERIKELELDEEQYQWYLDLHRHGTVKHSGFSFQFDHMVLFATGLTDVRDVVPFARSYGKANN